MQRIQLVVFFVAFFVFACVFPNWRWLNIRCACIPVRQILQILVKLEIKFAMYTVENMLLIGYLRPTYSECVSNGFHLPFVSDPLLCRHLSWRQTAQDFFTRRYMKMLACIHVDLLTYSVSVFWYIYRRKRHS